MLEPQYKDNAEQAAGKLGAAGQGRMHDGVRAGWGRQDFAPEVSGPHIFLAPSKIVAVQPILNSRQLKNIGGHIILPQEQLDSLLTNDNFSP